MTTSSTPVMCFCGGPREARRTDEGQDEAPERTRSGFDAGKYAIVVVDATSAVSGGIEDDNVAWQRLR
ncbi:MAG TPA: hypothetical protein VKH82_02570 [Candidatus Binatia bacterium]|nr:hypothetical protein [Candidatus Binatia bacterium]